MRRTFLALAFTLLAASAFADTPPTGSPAADGEWPRLIVTADNRAAILDYIGTNYGTQFQTFLTKLAAGLPYDVSGTAATEYKGMQNVFGPINYAFLAALGTANIAAYDGPDAGTTPDFTIPAAIDTDAETCDLAYASWSTDVADGTEICTAGAPCKSQKYRLLNWVYDSTTTDPSQATSYDNVPWPMSDRTYYPVSYLMFDWCHAELTAAEKQDVFDAFYDLYTTKWAPLTLATGQLVGGEYQLTGARMFVQGDLVFAATAWGDIDLDETKRQTLYNALSTVWLTRFVNEQNGINPSGRWMYDAGWDYWTYGLIAFTPAVAALDTALNTSLTGLATFNQQGKGLAAMLFPEYFAKTTGCGTAGTTPCPSYSESFGWNNFGVPVYHACKPTIAAIGLDRFMALHTGTTAFTDDAELGAWVFDNYVNRHFRCNADRVSSPDANGASTTIGRIPWSTAVLWWFLFGAKGVTAATPTATDVLMGNGTAIFRKDYTVNDTYVYQASHTYNQGHSSKEDAHFTLHKFGPLVVKAGNDRTGQCMVDNNVVRPLMQNNVGIHTGASDAVMGPDAIGASASFAVIAGTFTQRSSGHLYSSGTTYSYAFSDQDYLWTQATKMQREFTYLRGATDHEYFVIFDRANVTNSADNPIWKLWVVAQPACVDASCTEGAFAGKWTTTGKVLSVDNTHARTATIGSASSGNMTQDVDGFLVPATHGKLFLKAVLPADAELRMYGDDGSRTLMYQDGNDTGTEIMDSACANADHNLLYGWGRIESRPVSAQTVNTFLNVIQFGDATTLSAMTDSTVASISTPGWSVASIADTAQHRIVAFANDASESHTDLFYVYPQRTPTARHLVVNLTPGTRYYVQTATEAGGTRMSYAGPMTLVLAPTLLVGWRLGRRRAWALGLGVVVGAGVLALALDRATVGPAPMVTTTISTSPLAGATDYTTDPAGVLDFETRR